MRTAARTLIMMFVLLAVLSSIPAAQASLIPQYHKDTYRWVETPGDNSSATIYVKAPEEIDKPLSPSTTIDIIAFNISKPIRVYEDNDTFRQYETNDWHTLALTANPSKDNVTLTIVYGDLTIFHRRYKVNERLPIVEATPEAEHAAEVIQQQEQAQQERVDEDMERLEELAQEPETVTRSERTLFGLKLIVMAFIGFLAVHFWARKSATTYPMHKASVVRHPLMLVVTVTVVLLVVFIPLYQIKPLIDDYDTNTSLHKSIDNLGPPLFPEFTPERKAILHQQVDEIYPTTIYDIQMFMFYRTIWIFYALFLVFYMGYCYHLHFNKKKVHTDIEMEYDSTGPRPAFIITLFHILKQKGPGGLMYEVDTDSPPGFWKILKMMVGRYHGEPYVEKGTVPHYDVFFKDGDERRPATVYDGIERHDKRAPLVRKLLARSRLDMTSKEYKDNFGDEKEETGEKPPWYRGKKKKSLIIPSDTILIKRRASGPARGLAALVDSEAPVDLVEEVRDRVIDNLNESKDLTVTGTMAQRQNRAAQPATTIIKAENKALEEEINETEDTAGISAALADETMRHFMERGLDQGARPTEE